MWWLSKEETVLGMPGPRRWQAHCRQCSCSWHEHAPSASEVDICWRCGGQELIVFEKPENKETDDAEPRQP